ncbi:hypothetical protein EOI86_20990 [Hwanghaeella grinnelliae]|uniref:Glycerophosphoryl diester phosphodiesterase membrane domain-containing protein n=1 Tax=Hwanghaeella grinnelliae TaxID=2500179 RepID=A0A3S2Z4J4_9PROT|nr:hypothetical protein [Hwanghaeella grinnelliae]RVU33637.1 hypothetical protein EOI86_20990 [Hwanghaeella grinnelliae]
MTDVQHDPDEPHGLAMLQTVRWSIGFVFHNFGSLLKVSVTPFILTVFLTNAQKMIELFGIADLKGWGEPLFTVLILAVLVPQATAWHRFALLPDQKLRWCQFVFGKREVWFFAISLAGYLVSVLVGLAAATLIAPIPDIGIAVQILSILFVMWIMARCVLFLPAASIGSPVGFREHLKMTRGIAGRIIGVYLVAVILMTIFGMSFTALSEIAVRLSIGLPELVPVIAETLPRAFFNLLAVGVSISILSSIYKQILASEHVSTASPQPDAPGDGGS